MRYMKTLLVMGLVIALIFVFPILARKGQSLAESVFNPTGNLESPKDDKNPDIPESPSQQEEDKKANPQGDDTENPSNSDSSGSEATNSPTDPKFPETLTVVDAGELEAVKVRQKPSADSKALGIVYGSLTHVEVLRDVDDSYVEVYTRDYNSGKMIQGYMLKKHLKQVTANKQYGVLVNTEEQRVCIYKDGELFKTFVCSTGLDGGYETPEGIYLLGSRGASFYSPKYQQGAYNWVRFNKGYLFHSVPFDENKKIIVSEVDKLGSKASHGCIRLTLDDAEWFYDNIPTGTVVIVQ